MRFSAMGDVALTLPVIRGVLQQNADYYITLVTRPFFASFFKNIERLEVISADFSGRHKGLPGIVRLFKDLSRLHNFDHIIDLHGVIRTQVLSFLFQLKGKLVHRINKERKLKNHYLHLEKAPDLKHSIERYIEVFREAKVQVEPYPPPVFNLDDSMKSGAETFIRESGISGQKLIGIAPFAKHKLKVWPLNRVRNFIEQLSSYPQVQILLFGGGKYEKEQLRILASRYSCCRLVNLSLDEEIALIGRLDFMISMDSANMHIAALSGIPVISIWGATHPGMGFSAWKQPDQHTIQVPDDELRCRPCSIYGKGICHRGDFACMDRLTAEAVINRLEQLELISARKP